MKTENGEEGKRAMKFAGEVEVQGRAVLAPMAGVTDRAYRRICREMGAAATVTEMVSAKATVFRDPKTAGIAALEAGAHPSGIQIFGEEPRVMALAAEALWREAAVKPDFIDLNMGCPVPKIAGNRSGSALMRDPLRCQEMVAAVSAAVPVPVTVKMRKGWDEDHVNAVEIARICERAGAAAVCVHGRSKTQMYSGKADWAIIRAVKEAVEIPVIGNGDVDSPQAAARMLEETGCDFVMVGRAVQGNPWIFREINAWLDHETLLPPPTLSERILMIRRHITALCADKGEARGMREARKHVAWYIKGLRGAAEFRRMAGALTTLAELDCLLRALYQNAALPEPGESA